MKNIPSFIRELYGSQEFIPLHPPVFIGNEKSYLNDTIDSTYVSSVGAFVDRFEEETANLLGVSKSVAVVNGTSALQLALRLAGVQNSDEVITQALSFVATANAISYLGASPVFIDVDLDSMGLSPLHLNNFLNEYAEKREDGCYNKITGRKISACVPMHTFGMMCRIDEISTICDDWNINLVEDAAEAFGSKWNNKYAGSFGLINAFSFNGNKIITAGGGGLVCSNTKSIADKAKHLSTTAKKSHRWEYFHDKLGYNFRMPNVNAAIALGQLECLSVFISSKQEIFKKYQNFFKSSPIKLISPLDNCFWNHWLFSLCLENREERDAFLKYTNDNNIMTRPIWNLLFKLPMYKSCFRDDQKNAIYLEDRIVNIPSGAKV
jgi:aminotransferase in exopolysaccharide biosynthesis